VTIAGETFSFAASEPGWRKWRASDPTSPHWYTVEDFERLIGAKITHGTGDQVVRDFLEEFHGLSGTSKRRCVIDDAAMPRGATLRTLAPDGEFDHVLTNRLLRAMRETARAPKPEQLGIIGEAHCRQLAARYGGDGSTFEYSCKTGATEGVPWVFEAAFAYALKQSRRVLSCGLNFSPSRIDPFRHHHRSLGSCSPANTLAKTSRC
jgi:hypothetical protein